MFLLNFCFTGTAGDSLRGHNGMKFSTKDVDNDISRDRNCAQFLHGAWWFWSCLYSHLNGEYLGSHPFQGRNGIHWDRFKGLDYSYKVAEMKVGRDQN